MKVQPDKNWDSTMAINWIPPSGKRLHNYMENWKNTIFTRKTHDFNGHVQ